MKKIKIGIIGGAGYTGGELIRILLRHPNAEITYVHSKSSAGKPLYSVHNDLIGETDLTFADSFQEPVDVVFLCVGHGEAKVFLADNPAILQTKVIDLSQDFRDESNGFVYGLPELNKARIQNAQHIANPGCFATAIQLALLPLPQNGLLKEEVHISAITGSTGAGQKLADTVHFTWRNNNISVYKAFTHQHLKEIRQSLTQLQNNFSEKIRFIPYRGNFTRGILASVYTTFDGTLEEAKKYYSDFYQNHPFTHVVDSEIDVKLVTNTNKCLLHLEQHEDQLLITSVIDNLTKGASGQAVQNMNLLFGLDEKAGLDLKPVAF
ncbi:N-acetyl-gamma-glutamyl-phosphate reductase [Cytophagaceae bacterium YF14B1]|uniref:N-acetyl-gamma-glutamyl-phosphate reductase n=1 Tax=Xanthocytophaga flava TaxID=3048013 RepID=A0AAE3U626_9BACT|nr:N-acetyl-gamma-glutamyl-phosphate reductase [Xanthocytophaga flavus]MDJ1481424.1 N-acetyl-gamma-glutamyl-phosphate reductase [Xanthocytophaga flavus]